MASRTPPIYGPEKWKTTRTETLVHWDRWFLAVLETDFGGDWDALKAAVKERCGRSYGPHDDVLFGPTMKTRPGGGSKSVPRPLTSSTRTFIQSAMTSRLFQLVGGSLGPRPGSQRPRVRFVMDENV